MKSLYIKTALIASFISCLFSCTEEISVDVAHEPQTVISGDLTNLNEHVTVVIQQTLPLNSVESFRAVNDAEVSLFEKDINGTVHLLTSDFMVDQGVYRSSETVATTTGNKYWIEILLTDGSLFKSVEETMLSVISISEIEVDDEFEDVLNVSFRDPEATTNFYKVSVALFNQGQLVSTNTTESNDIIFNGNEDASIEIDLFRFENEDQPIPEYDTGEVSLSNINFSSYQFLLNQRAQIEANEDSGDSSGGDPSQLFSTPPVSLMGNITNVSTGRTALGNFTVSAVFVENQ